MDYQDLINNNPEYFSNEDAYIEIITDTEGILNWQAQRKKQLQEKNLPPEWGNIGIVYEDPYIIVLRDLVKFPGGRLGSYFRIINTADVNGGKGIVVLPIYDKKILILKQFRHATRKWHWEIPRGFGEPNTTPEENARKEISEEIDGEISKLIDLGSYNSNTGVEGVTVELFLAQLNKVGITNIDEGIESFSLFSIDEIEEMIRRAAITDGFTIAAYTRAKLRGLLD